MGIFWDTQLNNKNKDCQMATKQELLERADELGLNVPEKITKAELESTISLNEERIARQEEKKYFESKLLMRYDWFDYNGSVKEEKKGRLVKEVHDFDGVKKYGFEKEKEK